jgi:hypothetical protein
MDGWMIGRDEKSVLIGVRSEIRGLVMEIPG